MRDPYTVLGVARTASADEIKRAYRKLAKKLHPDVNPGDKRVEGQFKETTAAYELLSDATKRARFDRGEIDAEGNERPEFAFRRAHAGAGAGPGGGFQGGFEAPEGFGDIFEDLFGRRGRGRARQRGMNVTGRLHIDFLEAANGAVRRLTIGGVRTLDVRIPAGTRSGETLRLAGQGEPGPGGGPPGDALVEIVVDPHPYFRREGDDIHLDLPVTLAEAVKGARVPVPTVEGRVMLRIPPGSNSGSVLRLRGKGVAGRQGGSQGRGDQYVHLVVTLPDAPDDGLASLVEEWEKAHPYDPRAKAGMG